MSWLMALVQIAILATTILLVMLGRQIVDSLRILEGLLVKSRLPHHHYHTALTNYSTWTYREGDWKLVETRAEVGFEAGDPPRRPGAYEGETVRRPAVRSG